MSPPPPWFYICHALHFQGFAAVDRFVNSEMKVGLGTGSTAAFVVQRLGELLREGKVKNIVAVPTSESTRQLAEKWDIPLTSLNDLSEGELLDVSIDGADEVLLPHLQLIKGRGGALLREKMVAAASKKFVVVADDSKLVEQHRGLGLTGALPVEVIPFSSRHLLRCISMLPTVKGHHSSISIRKRPQHQKKALDTEEKQLQQMHQQDNMVNAADEYYMTDNGNHIIDIYFADPITDPHALHSELRSVVGVVETGLFLGMTATCLIGQPDGSVQVFLPASAAPN